MMAGDIAPGDESESPLWAGEKNKSGGKTEIAQKHRNGWGNEPNSQDSDDYGSQRIQRLVDKVGQAQTVPDLGSTGI